MKAVFGRLSSKAHRLCQSGRWSRCSWDSSTAARNFGTSWLLFFYAFHFPCSVIIFFLLNDGQDFFTRNFPKRRTWPSALTFAFSFGIYYQLLFHCALISHSICFIDIRPMASTRPSNTFLESKYILFSLTARPLRGGKIANVFTWPLNEFKWLKEFDCGWNGWLKARPVSMQEREREMLHSDTNQHQHDAQDNVPYLSLENELRWWLSRVLWGSKTKTSIHHEAELRNSVSFDLSAMWRRKKKKNAFRLCSVSTRVYAKNVYAHTMLCCHYEIE